MTTRLSDLGVSTTGNITSDSYFIGNGALLTGISGGGNVNFSNVASNIIPAANVTYSLGNATNQWTDLWVSNATIYLNSIPLGVNGNGTLQFDGNDLVTSGPNVVNTGNVQTIGDVIASNVIASSLNPNSIVYAGVNGVLSTDSSLYFIDNGGGEMTLFADYLSGFIFTNNISGNGANITLAAQFGNSVVIDTNGSLSAHGNISGQYILGNGSQLTGLPASYGNANVADYLPTYTGVLSGSNLNASGNISVQGNIIADGDITAGNFSTLGNVLSSNFSTTGNVSAQGNISAGGNVYASVFTLNNAGNLTYSSIQQNQNPPYGSESVGIEMLTTTDDPSVFSSVAAGPDYVSMKSTNAGNSNVIVQGGYGVTISTSNATGGSIKNWSFTSGGATLFPGSFSTSGNVYAPSVSLTGNILTNGLISTAGNIISGNFDTIGNLTCGGFYTQGDASVAGNISVNGNIRSGSFIADFGLAVTGEITATGNVTANYFIGKGNLLSNIAGANVSGIVANANIANIAYSVAGANVVGEVAVANTVSNPNQPNITALGTITSLTANAFTLNGPLTANGNAQFNADVYFAGNVTIPGNITQISGNSGQFFGNAVTGFGAFYGGLPAGYTLLNNEVAQFADNYDGYTQVTHQNINSGAQATGDFVITADNGTDFVNHIDMGMAGSGYDGLLANNSLGTSLYANDGYLYTRGNVTGGNLVLGSNQANGVVRIIANGASNISDVVATFSSSGLEIGDITAKAGSPAPTLTGFAFYGYNVSASGNIRGANFNTAGGISATGTIQSSSTITAASFSTTGAYLGEGNVYTESWLVANNMGVETYQLNAGNVSVSGNVTAGNLVTAGNVYVNGVGGLTSAGNAAVILADNVFATTSSVNLYPTGYAIIDTANGTNFDINGFEVANIDANGINVTGTVSANGNITAANLVISQGGVYKDGNTFIFTANANNDINGVHLVDGGTTVVYANGNTVIQANSSGTNSNWVFDTTGNLTFPGGQAVLSVDANSTISLFSDGAGNGLNGLFVSTNSTTEILNQGDVLITSDTGGNTYSWIFDATGNLILPTNTFAVNYANGTPVNLGGGNTNSISYGISNVTIPIADGNVQINAGVSGWTFTDNSIIILPGGGTEIWSDRILSPVNENFQITIQDQDNDGWKYQTTVIDGLGNTYSQTALDRDTFRIYTNLAATSYQWSFDNSGKFNLPGNIQGNYGGDVSLYILNGLGVGNVEMKTVNYSNDALLSNVTVKDTNVTISTNSNGNTWTFDNAGNLTLPGNTFAVNYANGTPVSLSGTTTWATLGNVSNAYGPTEIALGQNAGASQGLNSVAIGTNAGQTAQGNTAVAIGADAGANAQSDNGVAIGSQAGYDSQGVEAIAIGGAAGTVSQSFQAVAIGTSAGGTYQGESAVAIGPFAGETSQGQTGIAIGLYAGQNTQGIDGVAIGDAAGQLNQAAETVAVGKNAGNDAQGQQSIAIGSQAGVTQQGTTAVSVGYNAGYTHQGQSGIAIGYYAGYGFQGGNSIAIGANAGENNQANNSIILNASGLTLDGSNSGLYISPVRNDTGNTTNAVYYNTTTKEVTYGPAGGGSSGEAPFTIQTSNFNAVAGGRYGIDTTGGGWIATLPATPTTGQAIFFADAGGAYSTNAFVVDPNGQTIMGASGTMTVTTNGQSFGLFYNGTTWRTYY